jgi:uncharacterized MAPEG superfamily protein
MNSLSTELTALLAMLVVAIAYILVPTHFRNKETGIEWNMGPRDEPGPPMGQFTGRLMRAKANLYETLPIYIAAVLVVELQNIHTLLTGIAAWLYPLSRIAYMPLYAYGVPGPRTAAFAIGMMGVGALIIAPFLPA